MVPCIYSARPQRFLTTSESHEAFETARSITMASSAMPTSVKKMYGDVGIAEQQKARKQGIRMKA